MISIAILLTLAIQEPPQSDWQDCPADLMTIDGVELLDSEERIVEVFGEPIAKEQLSGEIYDQRISYDKVEALFVSSKLEYLESSRKGSCAGRDICVGSPMTEAIALLQSSIVRGKSGETLHCIDTASACSLVVEGNVFVQKVRLQCLP